MRSSWPTASSVWDLSQVLPATPLMQMGSRLQAKGFPRRFLSSYLGQGFSQKSRKPGQPGPQGSPLNPLTQPVGQGLHITPSLKRPASQGTPQNPLSSSLGQQSPPQTPPHAACGPQGFPQTAFKRPGRKTLSCGLRCRSSPLTRPGRRPAAAAPPPPAPRRPPPAPPPAPPGRSPARSRGARTTCSIFMASSASSGSPSFDNRRPRPQTPGGTSGINGRCFDWHSYNFYFCAPRAPSSWPQAPAAPSSTILAFCHHNHLRGRAQRRGLGCGSYFTYFVLVGKKAIRGVQGFRRCIRPGKVCIRPGEGGASEIGRSTYRLPRPMLHPGQSCWKCETGDSCQPLWKGTGPTRPVDAGRPRLVAPDRKCF